MNLFIISGSPGSGKTTMAEALSSAMVVRPSHFEADMFFIKDGKYQFDRSRLKEAHQWCQDQVRQAMESDTYNIIVSNTFTKAWERKPYLDMAMEYGYNIIYIHFNGCFANIHGVPPEVVERMRNQYEPYNPKEELK